MSVATTSRSSAVDHRSQLAESAVSMIQFHCVICFDEFNTTDRPPMVLPCGHTYVCQPCTKRLKRCMECRESLFIPAPGSNNQNEADATTMTSPATAISSMRPRTRGLGSRFGPAPVTPPQPPQPQPQIALPIPKNLVLLAMMEAADRQNPQPSTPPRHSNGEGKDGASVFDTPSAADNESSQDHDCDDDDDDDDDDSSGRTERREKVKQDRMIASLATLAGPCGTYVVREPAGLVVLPKDPRKRDPVVVSPPRAPRASSFLLERSRTIGRNGDSVSKSFGFIREPSSHLMALRLRKRRMEKDYAHRRDSSPSSSTPAAADVSVKKGAGVPSSPTASTESSPLQRLKATRSRSEPSSPSTFAEFMEAQDRSDAPSQRMPSSPSSNTSRTSAEPFRVECGQQLQVVSFEGGVATLARNHGFLLATRGQLVKVGGPREESCRLQGLQDTIKSRVKGLERDIEENNKVYQVLSQQVQVAQCKPAVHPVITDVPPPPPELAAQPSADSNQSTQDLGIVFNQIEFLPATPPGAGPNFSSPPSERLLQPTLQTPPPPPQSATFGVRPTVSANLDAKTCPTMPGTPNSIDNSDLEVTRNSTHISRLLGSACGAANPLLTMAGCAADPDCDDFAGVKTVDGDNHRDPIAATAPRHRRAATLTSMAANVAAFHAPGGRPPGDADSGGGREEEKEPDDFTAASATTNNTRPLSGALGAAPQNSTQRQRNQQQQQQHTTNSRGNGSRSPKTTTLEPNPASFDSVDFRTGLSGHSGLGKRHFNKHSPRHGRGAASVVSRPRTAMGDHRGLVDFGSQVRRTMSHWGIVSSYTTTTSTPAHPS